MNHKELVDRWVSKEVNAQASISLWNAMASDFNQFEIPTKANNAFMNLLDKEKILDNCNNALDIGCGTGKYAIALSDYFTDGITGIDISPKMIKYAEENAFTYNKKNIIFKNINWKDLDLDTAKMYKAFDLVYAHNTPAIQSGQTLKKMIDASRKWCVLSKPTRRRDTISDSIEKLVGNEPPQVRRDIEILYTFELLWMMGFEPKISYKKQSWDKTQTLEEAQTIYLNRVKTHFTLNSNNEIKIKNFLEKQLDGGFIHEHTETTITTIYWKV